MQTALSTHVFVKVIAGKKEEKLKPKTEKELNENGFYLDFHSNANEVS